EHQLLTVPICGADLLLGQTAVQARLGDVEMADREKAVVLDLVAIATFLGERSRLLEVALGITEVASGELLDPRRRAQLLEAGCGGFERRDRLVSGGGAAGGQNYGQRRRYQRGAQAGASPRRGLIRGNLHVDYLRGPL